MSSTDLGRFLVQDDSCQANGEVDDGEPAVITLAMEPRDDDHYLSAVNHDEDADNDDMAFMPQDLRYYFLSAQGTQLTNEWRQKLKVSIEIPFDF